MRRCSPTRAQMPQLRTYNEALSADASNEDLNGIQWAINAASSINDVECSRSSAFPAVCLVLQKESRWDKKSHRLSAINTTGKVMRPSWRNYDKSLNKFTIQIWCILGRIWIETFGIKRINSLFPPTITENWSQKTASCVFWSSRRSHMQNWKRFKSHTWDKPNFLTDT